MKMIAKLKQHCLQLQLTYCEARLIKFYLPASLPMLFLEYMSLKTHFRRFCYLSLGTELRASTISHCIKLPPRAPDSSLVPFPLASFSHSLLILSLQILWLSLLIHTFHSKYDFFFFSSLTRLFFSITLSLTQRWDLRVRLFSLLCSSLGKQERKWKAQNSVPVHTYPFLDRRKARLGIYLLIFFCIRSYHAIKYYVANMFAITSNYMLTYWNK